MFYKQIILNNGIPFEVKIPEKKIVDISTLTDEQLNQELEKGYADIQTGNTISVSKAFADIRKYYSL